jgi:hypothetical protein
LNAFISKSVSVETGIYLLYNIIYFVNKINTIQGL